MERLSYRASAFGHMLSGNGRFEGRKKGYKIVFNCAPMKCCFGAFVALIENRNKRKRILDRINRIEGKYLYGFSERETAF